MEVLVNVTFKAIVIEECFFLAIRLKGKGLQHTGFLKAGFITILISAHRSSIQL